MKPLSPFQDFKYFLFHRIWGRGITAYGLCEDTEYLVSHLSDRISMTLKSRSYQEEALGLMELPENWRYLVPLDYYSMQVINGGHHQFFMNSEGALNDLVEQGLQYFKFSGFEEIFKEALSCYDVELYEESRAEDWEQFAKGYDDSPLNAVDDHFYDSEPRLEELLDHHVRSRLSDYMPAV